MRSMWKIVTAGLLALVFGNAANAADASRLPPSSSMPPPPLLQSAPLLVDEFGSGWYLRGDVGYRMNKVDEVTNAGVPSAVTDSDLDKSWVLGVGVGYKLDWFRTDLTVDYGTKSKFSGDSRIQDSDFTGKIDSVTGLVNIYGDLGTWFGLTPYVGVGAGFAHLQAANFQVASSGGPDADSTGSWNFAWAYMAGISYKIFGNSHVDFGYRHVNMGDVTTGLDTFGNQLTFKKMAADEFKLGFRYVLD